MLLEEKVVLVTGAASGIGRGVCEAVAEAGGDVVVTDLRAAAPAATVAAVESAGRRALALELDVTDRASIERALEAALDTFGRIHGLVNNAGVLAMDPALDARREDWTRQFEVNLHGLFACCQLTARRMVAQGGGSIVNVASNAGKVGYPDMAGYNASKAAVISLTRSLAMEWAQHGINVNAVCPGGVATPMLEAVAEWVAARSGEEPGELLSTMTAGQLGRHIRPVEVGRVVAFLLSDHAVIVRGQAINVDAGDSPY